MGAFFAISHTCLICFIDHFLRYTLIAANLITLYKLKKIYIFSFISLNIHHIEDYFQT
jgi:hypothetical protein